MDRQTQNKTIKSGTINQLLETFEMKQFGRELLDSIEKGKCVCCGRKAENFRDLISFREYHISGLCQICQNKTFKESVFGQLGNYEMRFHQNISKRKTKDGYYYDIDKCGALCEDEVEIVQYLHPDMRRRRMTCKTDKETIQKSNKMLLEAFFADPTCRDKSKIIIGVSWLDKNNSLITGVADNFESPNSNTFVLSSLIAKLYSTRQGDEMKR